MLVEVVEENLPQSKHSVILAITVLRIVLGFWQRSICSVAYAAGYLEGFVTAHLIYMNWVNVIQPYCKGEIRSLVC